MLINTLVLTSINVITLASCSSRPHQLKMVSFGPTHAKIKWSPPTAYDGQLTKYHILYTQDKNLVDRKWEKLTSNGKHTEIVVKNLVKFVTYYIKVKARFEDTTGQTIGQASDVLEFSLAEPVYTPEMKPTITKITSGRFATMAQIFWRAPEKVDGRVVQYHIYYSRAPLSRAGSEMLVTVLDKSNLNDIDRAKELQTTLFNLETDTDYEFMVKAKTSDDMNGIKSEVVGFRTPTDEKYQRSDAIHEDL